MKSWRLAFAICTALIVFNGCKADNRTESEIAHEQFLEKVTEILGEDHRKVLDYKASLEATESSCKNQAGSTYTELRESQLDADIERRVLLAKKELYEALAAKNRLDILPSRIHYRCIYSYGDVRSVVEAVYEEKNSEDR